MTYEVGDILDDNGILLLVEQTSSDGNYRTIPLTDFIARTKVIEIDGERRSIKDHLVFAADEMARFRGAYAINENKKRMDIL